MGFKEFNQSEGERFFIRACNLHIDFGPLFKAQYDQLKRRLQGACARYGGYQYFACIGASLLDQNGRRPAMNAGLILNDCRDLNHTTPTPQRTVKPSPHIQS